MPEILVIKPSSFGDIVHGLQVAESIRCGLPDARISWIAARGFAPLVRACATVDTVFEFERRGGLAGFGRLMREVRTRRFDYVLDLQGLARSALMTWLAHGARKVGRRDAREGARWFYRERVSLPPDAPRVHALEILLRFLPVFGLEPRLEGHLRFATPAAMPELPDAAGNGGLVLMFPDSRRPEKNWPGFRALTERLAESCRKPRIAWAGTTALPDPELPGEFRIRFINLTSRTKIDALPGLIAAADLVVSNDSGPMHLAAAMGRRVLALFGPTDPRRFGPYPLDDPRHRVLRAPHDDLAALEPDTVAAAAEEMLAVRP